jgi:hypothetical protein
MYFEKRIQLRSWLAISAGPSICPGEILPVIHGEIKVMESVMSGAIDDSLKRMVCNHVRVMNLFPFEYILKHRREGNKNVQGYSKRSQKQKDLGRANDARGRGR